MRHRIVALLLLALIALLAFRTAVAEPQVSKVLTLLADARGNTGIAYLDVMSGARFALCVAIFEQLPKLVCFEASGKASGYDWVLLMKPTETRVMQPGVVL